MAFDNNFNTTSPEGSDQANKLDTFIRQDTKAALAERINLEHFTIDGTGESNMIGVNDKNDPQGQGRAIAGKIGCLGYGTSAERELLDAAPRTNCGIGAMWVNTDESTIGGITYPAGTMLRYTTSGWEPAQLVTGTIYADDEQVDAGADITHAINPAQLKADLQTLRVRQESYSDGSAIAIGAKREFNVTVTDTIADSSVAGSDITLPSGVYKIDISAGFYMACSDSCSVMSKMYLADSISDELLGLMPVGELIGHRSSGVQGGTITSTQRLTLLAETTFYLRHYYAADNPGRLTAFTEGTTLTTVPATTNCYLDINIERVRDI